MVGFGVSSMIFAITSVPLATKWRHAPGWRHLHRAIRPRRRRCQAPTVPCNVTGAGSAGARLVPGTRTRAFSARVAQLSPRPAQLSPRRSSPSPRRSSLSQPHSVAVAVAVGAGMEIAGRGGLADLAEDDDPGRASIDAQCTAGADVVVDGEHEGIGRVEARLLGALGLHDRARVDHVDALPRADVDAALARDALGLVDVDELFRLDGPRQVIR